MREGEFEPDDNVLRLAEVERRAAKLTAHISGANSEPLPFISAASWHGKPVPPRQWAVQDKIPARNVTLLSGEGAIGKTIVLLQLCIAHALGRDWLGTLPEPGPVIYLNAEDEEDELQRRIATITEHYTATHGDTLAELTNLHLLPFAGKDAVLGYERNGMIQPTPLLARLREAACDIKPKLIGLDTSADIFAGNENDRAQVRQFVGMLRGMAITANTAVMICSHPSLTGINSGSGLSGSTAWHNSVRARAYMHAAVTEKGEEPDRDLRVVEFMKSNYGPISETITLRWKNGLFLPEASPGSLDQLAAEQKADTVFCALLDRYNAQNRNVSDKRNANNYAPTLFAHEPETKGIRRKTMEEAMRRLFSTDKIKMENYGRGWQRLVRSTA